MSNSSAPLRAIVFDAYGTLFDVYSVGALAEHLYPGKGDALTALWRTKQIEYSQLRTLCGRYRPFWEITADGLRYAAKALGLALDEARERQLLNQYACLSPFPENLGVLKALKALGLPLAILSNGTPEMLGIAVKSAGMNGLFDHILSVDSVQRFKTAPEAYQLGPDALGCKAGEILFVSSNCWDACGATWFGYQTFWINRADAPLEELGIQPTHIGHRLTEVLALAERSLGRSVAA